jgi:hypothetical protein
MSSKIELNWVDVRPSLLDRRGKFTRQEIKYGQWHLNDKINPPPAASACGDSGRVRDAWGNLSVCGVSTFGAGVHNTAAAKSIIRGKEVAHRSGRASNAAEVRG